MEKKTIAKMRKLAKELGVDLNNIMIEGITNNSILITNIVNRQNTILETQQQIVEVLQLVTTHLEMKDVLKKTKLEDKN